MQQKMKPYGALKIVVVKLNLDDAIRTSQTRGDIFALTGADIWKDASDTPSGT